MGRRKKSAWDSVGGPAPVYGPAMPRTFSELAGEGPVELTPLERLARQAPIPDEARRLLRLLDIESEQAARYVAARGLPGLEGYEIEQIRIDHAPNSVEAYLRLVPGSRDTTIITQDGRTGAQVLIDDLSTLVDAIRQMMQRANEAAVTDVQAQHRFLTDKYEEQGPDLSI